MDKLKRMLGVLWMAVGAALLVGLLYAAVHFISQGGTKDIHNPVIWVIIIAIFTPISLGLMIFGWYAVQGEYRRIS